MIFFSFFEEIFTVSFVLAAEVSGRETCSCGSQARSSGLRDHVPLWGTRRSSVGKSAWRAPGAELLNTGSCAVCLQFKCDAEKWNLSSLEQRWNRTWPICRVTATGNSTACTCDVLATPDLPQCDTGLNWVPVQVWTPSARVWRHFRSVLCVALLVFSLDDWWADGRFSMSPLGMTISNQDPVPSSEAGVILFYITKI
jgi:hypothetical protein